MRQLLLFIGCVFLVFSIAFVPALQAQVSGKPTVSPTMPFELLAGFLVVVHGQIGNLDGLKFILDTGATYTLIDRKVADRLHLQRSSGEIMNFDHNIAVEWADIPELRVGPIRAEALRVAVLRLPEYSQLAEHVDGIIGLDLLSQSRKFSIDYDGRTVSLELPRDRSPERSRSALFLVSIIVQGVPVHLELDTGLQGIILYKNRLRQRLPNMRIEGKPDGATIGRLRGTQVRLPGVRIVGGESVTTFILIDGPEEGTLPGLDGILGIASLGAKYVEFDFDTRTLRWQ